MALEVAERFLAWLQIEQGRAGKTIEAYRRDLRDYEVERTREVGARRGERRRGSLRSLLA
jgi:site-specific recombinase XerD